MEVYGSTLCWEDQQEALRAYVHRFTKDHVPAWVRRAEDQGKDYPYQFASDREWLDNTLFKVKANGRIDHRARYSYSTPTWPDNPELRRTRGSQGATARI